MKNILTLIALLFLNSCYNQETLVDKTKILKNDYRMFQSTPAWTLSKAVEAEDVDKIKEEVLKNKIPVDFKDPINGKTLLMMSIYNSKYESAKTLLELGANPNYHDTYEGKTPVIDAAGNADPKYLKLILEYKGDPNSIENIFPDPKKIINPERNSALTSCISAMDDKNDLEKVKLLVEAGADINYTKKGIIQTVFVAAIIQHKMDVAMYLIEKGADYTMPITTTGLTEKNSVTLLQILRGCIIDLNSEQYKYKMKLVAFLKSKGLDYFKEPINQSYVDRIKYLYPDNWKEYVKKY
jgi:ankyrin repeat protein